MLNPKPFQLLLPDTLAKHRLLLKIMPCPESRMILQLAFPAVRERTLVAAPNSATIYIKSKGKGRAVGRFGEFELVQDVQYPPRAFLRMIPPLQGSLWVEVYSNIPRDRYPVILGPSHL